MLIIIFLKSQFKLYCFEGSDFPDSIEIDGIEYLIDKESKDNQGFAGFFDWLRIDRSSIVGLRICFFESPVYNKNFLELPYVIPHAHGEYIELFFKGNVSDPTFSDDQDFSSNYMYRSTEDTYLLTFGLDHLSDGEMSSLKNFCTPL